MRIISVDYSMTSPCLMAVDPQTCDFKTSNVYYLTDNKKLVGQFQNMEGTLHKPFSCPEERYYNIAAWAYSKVQYHQPYHVYIEGYSMGSRGLVFNIGENCGLLKQILWKARYAFTTIPPTTVKKVFGGKGNLDKAGMEKAFIEKTGIDLKPILGIKILKSPAPDIVDAFAVAFTGLTIVN